MDNLHRAFVTLAISGDDLVPSEITKLLAAKPKLGVRKGEAFVAGSGRERHASTGMWHVAGDYRSPPNLNEQISQLLSGLPSDASIWSDLTTRFDCCLSVGAYFNDWTGRGLLIDFDLYAPNALN